MGVEVEFIPLLIGVIIGFIGGTYALGRHRINKLKGRSNEHQRRP